MHAGKVLQKILRPVIARLDLRNARNRCGTTRGLTEGTSRALLRVGSCPRWAARTGFQTSSANAPRRALRIQALKGRQRT